MDCQPNVQNLALKRVGIVVGEPSGDTLAAGLIRELKARFPGCEFEGIGGPKMIAEGFNSRYPMDRLSVMGLIEPLKRLGELLRMRKALRKHFIDNPPDVFIGVDSPDFNLGLEGKIRAAGILTVHYVSPSVWAWRQKRVLKVARAVDLMLTLFPFEARFYEQHNIRVAFVGHTLADQIPLQTNKAQARVALGLAGHVSPTPVEHGNEKKYLAVLPGSRAAEVRMLGDIFLQAAQICQQKTEGLHILIPAANEKREAQIHQLLKAFPGLQATVFLQKSHQVMAAADVVLMASGTTTLEAMLLKRPMVIAYRLSRLTFAIVRHLVKVPFVGLPNLLAEKKLVPEFLQEDVNPQQLSDALLGFFRNPESSQALVEAFDQIHYTLQKNADLAAADAICDLLAGKVDDGVDR